MASGTFWGTRNGTASVSSDDNYIEYHVIGQNLKTKKTKIRVTTYLCRREFDLDANNTTKVSCSITVNGTKHSSTWNPSKYANGQGIIPKNTLIPIQTVDVEIDNVDGQKNTAFSLAYEFHYGSSSVDRTASLTNSTGYVPYLSYRYIKLKNTWKNGFLFTKSNGSWNLEGLYIKINKSWKS